MPAEHRKATRATKRRNPVFEKIFKKLIVNKTYPIRAFHELGRLSIMAPQTAFQAARPLPLELFKHCVILLEEKMCRSTPH